VSWFSRRKDTRNLCTATPSSSSGKPVASVDLHSHLPSAARASGPEPTLDPVSQRLLPPSPRPPRPPDIRGSSHGSDRPIRPNSECADTPSGARLPCSQIPPLRPRRRDAAGSPSSNCLSSDQPVAMSERHSEAGIRRRSRSPDQNSIEGVERLLASAVADQADPAFWSITGLRPVLRGCWPRHGHVGVVLCAVACAS
jgi:hypothetical protein